MKKKKRRLKSKARLVLFITIMLVLFSGGFVAASNYLWPLIAGQSNMPGILGGLEDKAALAKLDGMTVLMMGVDAREAGEALRTDSMILAHVNNKEKQIALLSIPRDTKVQIPGYGVNKINTANVLGGPELAKEVVADITGIKVDYFITTNFDGFQGIVDALGGVTVDVDKNMNHTERAYGGVHNIHLTKGVQKLNGEQALGFVRYRSDNLGDIARTERQLKLLTAIGNEVMKPSVVTKLPKLIPEVFDNVETDMGLKQMVSMAKAAKNIEDVQIISQTLPGWFLDEDVSYWYVDPAKAREVAAAFFKEGIVVDAVLGDISSEKTGKAQMAMGESGSTTKTGTNSNSVTEKNKARLKTAEDQEQVDDEDKTETDHTPADGGKEGNKEQQTDAGDELPPPGYYIRSEAVAPMPDPADNSVQIIITP